MIWLIVAWLACSVAALVWIVRDETKHNDLRFQNAVWITVASIGFGPVVLGYIMWDTNFVVLKRRR